MPAHPLTRSNRIFATLAAALLVLTPVAIRAQVQASIVAADQSVQPGHPITIALRLDHQSGWHTYWIGAGTGYPTTLQWDLPAGWTAGSIQWPTPVMIRNEQGDVTGNGYTDVVDLPVTLTPPESSSSGGRVTAKALAKWLMCAKICIPGHAEVALTLPVSVRPPESDTAVRAELASMPMPGAARPGWHIVASRTGNQVLLEISGAGSMLSPHFFSEDAFIRYDQGQDMVIGPNSLAITLQADDADASTQDLLGILAYTDAAGGYHGLPINAHLSYPVAAVSAVLASDAADRPMDAALTSSGGPTTLGFTLMLALAGGLILNLTPSVFPVLGIRVVGLVDRSARKGRRVFIHGLAFTLGILLSSWILAAVLAAQRSAGEQLGWGFQLQSPQFVFVVAVVVLVLALYSSGVFQFGSRATGADANRSMQNGYLGSLFAGVLATVVATPCCAPFLAPTLGPALTLPTLQSFLVFTCIGVGLSAPYLLLSLFPTALKVLPRPGAWMQTFKQLMAFPLFGTVAYLIWVLAGQVSESGLLWVLLGLTVIAMAVWIYGRTAPPPIDGLSVPSLSHVGALALLVLGLNLSWPRAPAPTEIVWESWSAERVARLRAAGQPFVVDFTARWCAACQANKNLVFRSDKIKCYLRDHKVATLEADWTNTDPLITAELANWHRNAVPFNLVYPGKQSEPRVLPELLTPGIVLDALKGS
jgi:thiol:disulfide interchange protein/DsbC/DsbD-like thiol-disulfide interchange protein